MAALAPLQLGSQYYLEIYHSYWIYPNGVKTKNPRFDRYGGFVLDLKDGYDRNFRFGRGLRYFRPRLAQTIERFGRPLHVCVIPSSTAQHDRDDEKLHGATKLVQTTVQSPHIDATACLERVFSIEKASMGGPRDVDLHLESIRLNAPELIKGRDVLLFDDIQTSGASMTACAQLLRQAQPRTLTTLALGQTFGRPSNAQHA